jgi:hypothetical protein
MTHFVHVAVRYGRSLVLFTRYTNIHLLILDLFSAIFISQILAQDYLLIQGILAGEYNLGKLAITTEAQQLSYHVKVQLLLILIETLNLETLLQMVHDETPYRLD